MKIEIELGFSHIRDSIKVIDEALAMGDTVYDHGDLISLQHLRNALFDGLNVVHQRLLLDKVKKGDRVQVKDSEGFIAIGTVTGHNHEGKPLVSFNKERPIVVHTWVKVSNIDGRRVV